MKILIILSLTCNVFLTSEISAQVWTQTNSTPHGAGVTDIVVTGSGAIIVTTASHNWPSGQQGGIRRSTDGGNSWQNVLNAYNGRTLFLGSSGKIFASCWLFPQNEGMFFSSDDGLTWIQTYFGFANDNVFSIAAKNSDSMVYIGTRNGVFRSFNNGTWLQINSGLPANSWVRDLSISSDGIILAATTKGVFKSTNQGNAWISAGTGIPSSDTVISLSKFSSSGQIFCAVSSGKAYRTSSSSFNWSQIFSLRSEQIGKIDISPEILADMFMIMIGNIMEEALDDLNYSYDDGENWFGTSIGISGPAPVSSFAIRITGALKYEVHAGLFLNKENGAKIFKSELNKSVGVNQLSAAVPDSYSLSQNFPNPFNPVTKIQFEIPDNVSSVKLIVYDALGKQVETIVDQTLAPGSYETMWNASNFSSGIYFYRLTADDFTLTKRMILSR